MPARRFFVEGVHAPGDRVPITGADARKIVTVLRLSDGARIEVVDSGGTAFDAQIELSDGAVKAALIAPGGGEGAPETLRVDIAQAVPKGAKMDFVIEKVTELGAGGILPFYSERSVVVGARSEKVERWRRLAKTAAQQCGARRVPAVEAPMPFETLLERFSQYDTVLFPWELAEHVPLRSSLPPLLKGARRVLVVVGPEGGFSHDEAEAARSNGAALLWLGPRILRTETAAMVLLAIIEYV